MSIRAQQMKVLSRMLNLHHGQGDHSVTSGSSSSSSTRHSSHSHSHHASSGSAFGGGEDEDSKDVTGMDGGALGPWKVLIYDPTCADIISPLFTTVDLRRLGVTLFLPLNSIRERVPDVPAIYFLSPTAVNVDAVLNDLSAGLYDTTYLHFSSTLPRILLERLATGTIERQCSTKIAGIFDEYCQFVCYEENLISLNSSDSYLQLNDTKQSDESMGQLIDNLTDSLFSILVTLGSIPIIRAPPNTAAALLASKLDERIRTHLLSRNHLFTNIAPSALSYTRPLLILVDRNVDLCAPLHHSWTYEALLNDLCGFERNRVSIPNHVDSNAQMSVTKIKKTSYDLNSLEDRFWRHNANKPFPEVAEAVQEKLKEYQQEYAAINSKTSGGIPGDESGSMTSGLADAISALPKLQKRKRQLDAHMSIATALLNVIKTRDVDTFFEAEQQWMARNQLDKTEIEKLLSSGKGTYTDRVRAACIWWLSNQNANENDLTMVKSLLSTPTSTSTETTDDKKEIKEVTNGNVINPLNALSHAFDYLRQYRFIHRLASSAALAREDAIQNSATGIPVSSAWSVFGKLTQSVVNQTAGVIANVRAYLPTQHDLPLVRIVEALSSYKESTEQSQYIYLDPKVPKGKDKAANRARGNITPGGSTMNHKDCIVFVLGGGCFAEYANLQDFARRSQAGANSGSTGHSASTSSLIYGCTELCSPEQFLTQLSKLGQHAAVSS